MKTASSPALPTHTRRSPAFALLALLLAWTSTAPAQTFDWSGVPEIHPGIQHVLIATNDIPALPANTQWRYINVLRIDLTEPSLRFHTTPRAPFWGEPMPPDPIDGSVHPGYFIRTLRQSNWRFIEEARASGMNMVASVNAAPWEPWSPLSHEVYADRLGLTVSAGVLVSEPNGRPSLVLDRDWRARLQSSPVGVDVSDVEVAVSGFSYVLNNGAVTATDAALHPRTAFGLCEESRYLYWMTIDGRINLVIDGDSRYLSGATLPEVGLLLQYVGAWDGLNMDGGFSTQMTTWDSGTGQLVQRAVTAGTSTQFHRKNGNNIGIYLDTRPPAVGRSPATLGHIASRHDETSAVIEDVVEVHNSGGGVLNCTITSDAPWVVVATNNLEVKGRRPLGLQIDGRSLPPGVHEATITMSNDDNPSDVQTVSVTLEVPRLPEDLPLVESFETWSTGQLLAGTNGWVGTTSAAAVREESYTIVEPPGPPLPLENHTRVARLATGLSREVIAAEQQNVKLDLMMQFGARGLTPPADMSPELQTSFGIDDTGALHIWHRHHDGHTWSARWTDVGHTPMAASEWVRLSVDFDYTTSPQGAAFFRPRINGSLLPTAYGFRAPDDLTSPGPWYMTANSPGLGGGGGPRRITGLDFAGPGAVDDLVIRDAAEAMAIYPEWMGFAHRGAVEIDGVALSWFDKWGLRREPGAPVAGHARNAKQAFLTGTDPLDPDASFRVIRAWKADGRFHLEFTGNDSGSKTPYVMRGTTNLADGVWEDAWLVPRSAAPLTTTMWSREMPTNSANYFYRIDAVQDAAP